MLDIRILKASLAARKTVSNTVFILLRSEAEYPVIKEELTKELWMYDYVCGLITIRGTN